MTAALEAVAVIGIGNMGLGMALRLRDGGWPVRVRDLRREPEAQALAAGATVAASPALAADAAALAIVAVVDAQQTESVLFGADGVVAAAQLPQAVMLCPTIAPQDVQRLGARLAEHGIGCLDAPMSGGPKRARDGTMSLMVAGEPALLARFDALLRHLASRLFVLGPRLGDGARTKLVNNLLAAANLAAAAEALALAQRMGLDPGLALSVIEQSSGASWIGSERLRRALAGQTTPLAHMSLLAKDSALGIAMATADSPGHAGMALPMGFAAASVFQAACAEGWSTADDAALYARALGQHPPGLSPPPPPESER